MADGRLTHASSGLKTAGQCEHATRQQGSRDHKATDVIRDQMPLVPVENMPRALGLRLMIDSY